MELKKILKKINSTYIIENIFTFIKDKNYKLKLFNFSKFFQKKFNLDLFNYQEIYFKKYNLNLNEFLNLNSFYLGKRTLLKDNFNNILTENNIDLNLIKSYIINYYKYKSEEEIKNENNLIFNSKLLIDISSPFFDFLLNTDIFEKYFIISIPINYFKEYNLKDEYISFFNYLNSINAKYSSLKIDFKINEDVDIIKELKINFEQIKDLNILKIGRDNNYIYNYFFSNLFSINSFGKNIKNLYINLYDIYTTIKLDSNSIEGLNNFQNLEKLKLNSFNINDIFTLNIPNLKELELNRCSNISFDNKLNLKKLILIDYSFPDQKSVIVLPNLEKCELFVNKNNLDNIKYSSIFDFSKFNKLKSIKCESKDFIHLTNNSILETADIFIPKKNSPEIERDMLKKILKLEKLREITFKLSMIDLNDIPNETNISIKKIKLFLQYNKNTDYILYNLLDKFINLSEIEIITEKKNQKKSIKLIENSNSKIEKITIEGTQQNIELYCAPFENLKYIKFKNNDKLNNLKETLPIFQEKCKVIFKSLIYFEFVCGEMKFKDFENLSGNLDKFPNLKCFSFDCIVNDMNKEYYKNFIKKLLSMNLDEIYLTMRIDNGDEYEEELEQEEDEDLDNKFEYSEKELKEIYPNLEPNKNYKISKIINNAFN